MLILLLLLVVLSIVVTLFIHELTLFLHFVGFLHAWLTDKLLLVFSNTSVGSLISHVITLVLLPLIVALIPAFIYWLFRRGEMPHLYLFTWVIWIMLITIIALR
jgi:hypothetical protein